MSLYGFFLYGVLCVNLVGPKKNMPTTYQMNKFDETIKISSRQNGSNITNHIQRMHRRHMMLSH